MSADPYRTLERKIAAPVTGVPVCDWSRREGDLLIENWVFVDIPYAMLQFGVDVPAPRQVRT